MENHANMPDDDVDMDDMIDQCIDECETCHAFCTQMVPHCLEMGGKHAELDHIMLLIDCAEICQTSANFLHRSSELHTATCRACAEVCERCAESCARFTDDPIMQQCAEACRSCAASCREMAGMDTQAR